MAARRTCFGSRRRGHGGDYHRHAHRNAAGDDCDETIHVGSALGRCGAGGVSAADTAVLKSEPAEKCERSVSRDLRRKMALEHMEHAAPAAPHMQRAKPRVQALRAKGKERAQQGLSKLKKLKERVAKKAAETLSSRRHLRNGAILLHSLDSDGADDDDEDHQDAHTSSRNHGGGRGSPSRTRSHSTVEYDNGVRVSVNVAVDVNRSYSCKRDPKTCLCAVCSPRAGLVCTSIWVQGICCPGEVPIIRR